ncbi:hypothetical protein V6N11_033906 [Hibiscus sabdariffa]|uniref:Uncharacterized protein n=1 Tax=Hibiscus sabdariffa TaxID=183260 RepID=A0ABR2S1B1_9ROSI
MGFKDDTVDPLSRSTSSSGKWEEAGHESPGKLPKISGENDNKTVEEEVRYQETELGLNDRSWAETLSVGIKDHATNVKGEKVVQECPRGIDRDGEKDLGLSTKEGVGALDDCENDTLRREVQGDLDTLNSFSEMDSEFHVNKKEGVFLRRNEMC